jgi:hypothetical protein
MPVWRVTCGESLTDQSVPPVAKVLVAPKLMLHVGCSHEPCAPFSVPEQCQSSTAGGVSTDGCLSFVSTVAPVITCECVSMSSTVYWCVLCV